MTKKLRALDWTTVALVLGVLAIVAATLVAIDDQRLEKLLDRDWGAMVLGAAGVLVALVGILRRGGLWKDAVVVLLAVGLGAATVGCGASPLRRHATAARLVMLSLDGAGQAIELATDEQLAACPDADGAERTACIDDVDQRMTTAAAARDALIAPAHAYRDAVQAAPEDAPDDALGYLALVARSVARDWDPFAEAMRALGVPVPDIDLGGGDHAGE